MATTYRVRVLKPVCLYTNKPRAVGEIVDQVDELTALQLVETGHGELVDEDAEAAEKPPETAARDLEGDGAADGGIARRRGKRG